MNTNWKALTPHLPLEPGSAEYVAPLTGGGHAIADWILAGGSTVLLGGPAGIGKSTELAHAARLLETARVSCLIPLDRWENMRRLTADKLLLTIAGRVASAATDVLHLELSSELSTALRLQGLPRGSELGRFVGTPESLAATALAEVARKSKQGRIALLIDGLEKVPPGPDSMDLFDALGRLRSDVDLVVVIPWHAAFGPRGDTVVRPQERLEMLRAPEVEGAPGIPGRSFLRKIITQRLPATVQMIAEPLIDEAARWSGGLPRIFLQLIADAGTYANLRHPGTWPSPQDLADAIADQEASFRRLLLPGDAAAIRKAAGTDGLELELDRKVRLMAHGVLLEKLTEKEPMLQIHPLMRATIEKAGANA